MPAMPLLWPGRPGPAISYISDPPPESFAKKQRRKIAILGSTGSIGRQALDICVQAQERIEVIGLAAGHNIRLLASQASFWRPQWLACASADLCNELVELLPADYRPQIWHGQTGYARLATLEEADLVLSAQSGSAGLAATLAAARAGKVIALANKESLVLAGGVIRRLCAESKAAILPVDSEHYAIFQCALGRGQSVKSLVLTASGGPFLAKSLTETRLATPEQALRHPTWNMGKKISIDSATMLNKGLELIEAMHLYGVGPEAIEILIHPQSIVHSLIELADNSQLAQLAQPDMRLALAGCLLWPDCEQPFIQALNLAKTGTLTFMEPDLEKFACLRLAREAACHTPARAWQEAGLNPACIGLNAANEKAVELFLAGRCRFGDIAEIVKKGMAIAMAADKAPEARLDPDSLCALIGEISANVQAGCA